MLTRFRIEVEEGSAEQCVLLLEKYEAALKQEESLRWGLYKTEAGHPVPATIELLDELLGRQLVEEVIAYDESIPGYLARRVVKLTRIDTRELDYGPYSPARELIERHEKAS